jgi:hypothetical protein
MNEMPASGPAPNAGSKLPFWVRVVIGLSLGGVVVAIGLIKMQQENQRREVQLRQQQARPAAGPSTSASFEKLQEGMTVEEVEAVMGPGARLTARGGGERLEWKQPLQGRTWIFYVSLKDGKVSAKGSEIW